MTWVTHGIVIEPPLHLPWVASHAAVPHAELLGDGRVRVFFTARDDRRRSHIAVADVDLDDRVHRVDVARDPLLAPGPAGAFDDSGVMTSCLVRHEGAEYLYYQGWALVSPCHSASSSAVLSGMARMSGSIACRPPR